MARREPRPLTLDVGPGQPRLAWHTSPPPERPLMSTSVLERVGEGPIAGRLIHADDNLDALRSLHAEGLAGQVDLIYIDPPFMAGSDRAGGGTAYRDTWPGGLDEYLDMLRARLLALRPLLAATGNLFVHLDWHAVHYAKVLLDELYGQANFRNEIVWRRANAHSDPSRFGVITDAILFYGASPRAHWADVHVPHAPDYIASHWRRSDARGRYRLVPLDAPRHGDGGQLLYPWRGKLPARTRTWAVPEATMQQLEREGRIVYTDSGTPTLKRHLADSPGLRAQNLWDDIPPVNPMASERLGYPTQKPVALLERVIAAACPPGGLVLDAFLGSGTTAEAAERLGRRWIGIDSNPAAIQLARRRLLALAETPRRGAGRPVYRECERCRQISRSSRSARTEPLVARAFTVERVCAPMMEERVPPRVGASVEDRVEARIEGRAAEGRVEARAVRVAASVEASVEARIELGVEDRVVRVQLVGSVVTVAAWSVDWDHAPPILAASTHHLRPRKGPIAERAEHTYADPGPHTIAVMWVDDAGAVSRSEHVIVLA